MKKKIITIGVLILTLLSIYTIAFSAEEVEKDSVYFPEADYVKGERFIYGSILKVDYENRKIIIEQHMDDNSYEINPVLNIREDVVIILKRNDKAMNIDLYDLKPEDRCGIVLDKSGIVRGIIISV